MMARYFPPAIEHRPKGKLHLEEVTPGYSRVYYIPSTKLLQEAGRNSSAPDSYKKLILEANEQNDSITIHPIKTSPNHPNFLGNKYSSLLSITLIGFNLLPIKSDGVDYSDIETQDVIIEILQALPQGFVTDYDYGLGLTRDYRFIIKALEDLKIRHLVISETASTIIDEKQSICTIKYSEFNSVRKTIDRIARESSKVSTAQKQISAHNAFAFFLRDKTKYPQKGINPKDTHLEHFFAKSSTALKVPASKSEQNEAIEIITSNKTKIAKEQPEKLMQLKNEIELVNLEQLNQQFENMLTKAHSEKKWQTFFNNNQFILSLAFGYPIIVIQEQAFVGGRRMNGSGEKIADFLVTNRLSHSTAIFEIKTPTTKILNERTYRDGVFVPSTEFSGAINQILDQKNKFQKNFNTLKEASRGINFESYAIDLVLIIGKMPMEDDKRRSFE
ncbi:MAG: Shedu immune nuclease family protein, partial [Holosporales bacterium]